MHARTPPPTPLSSDPKPIDCRSRNRKAISRAKWKTGMKRLQINMLARPQSTLAHDKFKIAQQRKPDQLVLWNTGAKRSLSIDYWSTIGQAATAGPKKLGRKRLGRNTVSRRDLPPLLFQQWSASINPTHIQTDQPPLVHTFTYGRPLGTKK